MSFFAGLAPPGSTSVVAAATLPTVRLCSFAADYVLALPRTWRVFEAHLRPAPEP